MAQAKLVSGATGMGFSPVVLHVQLTPAETALVLRYTGKRVTELELTEQELKSLMSAGLPVLQNDIKQIKQIKQLNEG